MLMWACLVMNHRQGWAGASQTQFLNPIRPKYLGPNYTIPIPIPITWVANLVSNTKRNNGRMHVAVKGDPLYTPLEVVPEIVPAGGNPWSRWNGM